MNNVQNNHEETSGAMSIDAATLHSKKRTITEVDKSDPSSIITAHTSTNEVTMTESNQDQIPTDPAGQTLDIAWREILEIIEAFRHHEPPFLPLPKVQQHIQLTITEEIHEEINRLRENTHMPTTLARDYFDSWTSDKQRDDLLTVHQLEIVLHFLDTLYTEFHMETEYRTGLDKATLQSRLLHVYPGEKDMISSTLQDVFDAHAVATLQQLEDTAKKLLHTLSRQPRQPISWLGRLPEANLRLAEDIFTDSPVAVVEQDEFIPLDELTTGPASTVGHIRTAAFYIYI